MSSSVIEVRPARLADASAVGRLVARAFQDDEPSTSWLFPDPAERARRLPLLFTATARYRYIPRGRVDVAVETSGRAERLLGVAVWSPPTWRGDRIADLLRMASDMVRALGSRLPQGIYEEWRAATLRRGRHWHLAQLAVHDDARGGGVGSRLLRGVLDEAEAPVYLECKQANVRYYRRFGFEPNGDYRLGADAQMISLRRDPVPGPASRRVTPVR